MLPFILALVLAVGLPLLPSRLYRALHLPTLRFNFLSARYAPDGPLVSSRETTLLIESSYSNEINPDSGGSSQYLVFPDISGPACSDDATAAASYLSLLGEQDYSQPSIWRFIHVHLLYQLAEATVIIALSFVAAATFLPRRYLSTFVERLCTALFISRQYSPKVAFSSFLQDVFCGLHKYWMDNSVAKGPAGNSAARDLIPLDKANLTDFACTCLPHTATHVLCSKTNVAEQEQPKDISGTLDECHPSPTTLTVTTPNRNLGTPDAETSFHPTNLPRTVESPEPSTNSSPIPSCTASLSSISMKDLYNSTRFATASTLLPESTLRAQEASTSDPFACPPSSCDRDPLRSIADANRHSESKSGPSSGISQDSRRRHKSDGVWVHAVRYHLGDTATPLAPAKVNVPRPSLESALESSNGSVQAREKEVSASGTLLGNWAAPRIRGNRPEKAECSPSSPDTALAGIVVTPQGELIVPASQRPDGSVRKEIRIRPGHSMREPLAEKYLPPARRRTSTWDPRWREYLASPPSSPHPHDSPPPMTPKSMRPRLFARHNNSPAALSDNWRRSNSGLTLTLEGTPPPKEVNVPPVVVETNEMDSPPGTSLQKRSMQPIISLPPTITMTTQAMVAVSNQDAATQPRDSLSSRGTTPGFLPTGAERVSVKGDAEATQVGKCVGTTEDNRANQQQEVSPSTPTNTKEGCRRPLQDITGSLSMSEPKAIEFPALHAAAATPTAITLAHVTNNFPRNVSKVPIQINKDLGGGARETALSSSPRKRKSPQEGDASEVLQPNNSLIPHRRSAPHLGPNRQQAITLRTAQTPEGSKRRRMRTASAKGVENCNIAFAVPATDQNGQIVLPAGMGWKGRSLAAGQPPRR
ncbi:hypothetical protein BC826DRAFT_1106021 [Russula brevipes]|nr:hypothetical protein BC826DRAFT_1106021 [Russula brevipes]